MASDKPKTIDGWIAFLKWQWTKGLETVDVVDVPSVPDDWEHFPGTKDLWKRNEVVESETGGTAFWYKPAIGSRFPSHVHHLHDEMVYVRLGSTKIFTPIYNVELKVGESIIIEKGIPHIFIFDDTVQSLFEISYPDNTQKGWTGVFLKE